MKTQEGKIYHTYPYGIGTFVENAREAGIREAFKEDFYMTTEKWGDALMEGMVFTGAALIALPVAVYGAYKGVQLVRRLQKQKQKALETRAQ